MPVALILAALLLVACAVVLPALEGPQPTPAPGFVAPAAGEHPRLLFRREDLPALRAKAQTAEGQAILARLRFLLGGGEALPTVFNKHPPVNIGARGPKELPPGAFTVSHAAGFGLLYQITGKDVYADLARQCVELVLSGQVDRDERYSWKAPGTGFRLSGVHQALALAYDLCYDGWPDEYRRSLARQILEHAPTALQSNGPLSLEFLAAGGKYPPGSNHFGAYIAGPGLVALALRGDPGVDTARLDAVLATVRTSMRRLFSEGFGDAGWFAEGAGSDKTAMLPGMAGLLGALRVAAGEDWCGRDPHARLALLTRALELVPDAEAVRRPERGHYAHGNRHYDAGRDRFRDTGAGWSSDGLFAIGLGALPPADRPGLAWMYEHFVEAEPGIGPAQRIYDARISPLHAVYAYATWPAESSQPREWPLAIHDSLHGYVLCRNRIQDGDDILFTGLARRGPTGYHKVLAPLRAEIWGYGRRAQLGDLPAKGATSLWRPGADGSACFTVGEQTWAVDFSGASGATGLIIRNGKPKLVVEMPEALPDAPGAVLDLSGSWSNDTASIVQSGAELQIANKEGKPWGTATVDGNQIEARFGKNIEVSGIISPSGLRIDWDNGAQWLKKGYSMQAWQFQPGEPICAATVRLAGKDFTVLTLVPPGTAHPAATVEGDALVIGEQRVRLDGEGLSLQVFAPRP